MAVKNSSSSSNNANSDGASDNEEQQTAVGDSAERRTIVYTTTDPFGHVAKMNGETLLTFDDSLEEWYRRTEEQRRSGNKPATSLSPSSAYRIVVIIGPVLSEAYAHLVSVLVLWRSRGTGPRTAWAKLIAERLYLPIWVDYAEVLALKHHKVVHEDNGDVCIRVE